MSTKRKRLRTRRELSPRDVIDGDLWIAAGCIVGFSLNYRAEFDGEWKEVLRYDTHHGRLHAHRFWRSPPHEIEYFEETRSAEYEAQYRAARADIDANWRRYRFLRASFGRPD